VVVVGVSVEGLNHGGVIQALKRGGKSFTLTVTRPTILATPSDDYMTDPTTTAPTASSTDGHVHDDTQSANIIKSIPDVTMHQSISPQDMAARVIHHIFGKVFGERFHDLDGVLNFQNVFVTYFTKANTKHNKHKTQHTQNTPDMKHNKHETQQTQNTTP
jgi:hypothetical protein